MFSSVARRHRHETERGETRENAVHHQRCRLPQSCCIAKNISYVDTVFDNFISNTPKPLKTHLQLNVGKLGHFDAQRVAIEDYLRSRRIFKTTASVTAHDDDPMEVDVLSRKGKGRGISARATQVARKARKTTLVKVTVSEIPRTHLLFEGECRNCGKYGHKAADCWHKQPKPQGQRQEESEIQCVRSERE